jgi:hypothetical protein
VFFFRLRSKKLLIPTILYPPLQFPNPSQPAGGR